ncbi:unnamed protein product [Calypogeia fissa]
MSRDVYWPDMKDSILQHVQSCYSCQKNRTVYRAKGGLLKPLPVPAAPWESISMDFIQGLPVAFGYDAILTIVDRFSKMAYFLPTRKSVSPQEVANMVFNSVFRMWGLPLQILSDRDSRFTGHFWKALFRLSGTDLTRGSAYHHETDGQTERLNLVLEEYVRHFVSADQKDWPHHMTMAEFRYNSTKHSAAGFAPFLLATGRVPRAPAWFVNPDAWRTESKVPAVDDFIRERRLMVEAATKGMTLAQSRYKEQGDKSRRQISFEIGERVWLQLRPEQYHSKISRKFAPRYAGPYRILRWAHKDNPLSVVLETSEAMGVGKSYHVSRLKKFVADTDPNRQQVSRPDAFLVEDVEEYEVEAILDHRYKRRLGKQLLEYLVKWTGYDQAECTWEPEENLTHTGEILGSYRKRSGLPPI